jgi:hypothetical protein
MPRLCVLCSCVTFSACQQQRERLATLENIAQESVSVYASQRTAKKRLE